MKKTHIFKLAPKYTWLIELGPDKVDELLIKYEKHLLEMDSDQILQYLYEKENEGAQSYDYTKLIN